MYDNRIFQISAITDEFPLLNTPEFGIGVVDWNNINPIPITEEALVKMGFEKDNYGGFKHKNLFSSFIKRPDYTFKSENVFYFLKVGDDKDEPEIKYVHQLQNLYYTLTQTELSYEPTH